MVVLVKALQLKPIIVGNNEIVARILLIRGRYISGALNVI
jgi:hypothetical protein